ncbi:hypothetical protein ACGYLX_18975 [Sulfitobacter sp. 1A13496]|uniref:hypothetical protein n=1 Tax=Sulfitobacter sp. 1A13496 TaxID=3368596 RepID=UPI003745E3AE
MAQASALAIGSACAFGYGFAPVVQLPLRPLYSDCTSYGCGNLAEATTSSVLAELVQRGGEDLHDDTVVGIRELVSAKAAMAEGTASPHFFLSSLDPGVGKTTTLIHFVQHLLRSEQHEDASVLLCFSQREEIKKLVEEIGFAEADFAILTSDEEINALSSTKPNDARVLFTTQEMIRRRCRGGAFRDAKAFHHHGAVRAVRIWDEEMLPGSVVSLSTDQLASLREPLRQAHPALAELVVCLERELEATGGKGNLLWPDVEEATGISQLAAQRGLDKSHVDHLDSLYALSGRRVLLRKPNNARQVITALDNRDAIPDDLAPAVILDASGRVRAAYEQWEKATGRLKRLPSVAKSYRNLTVHVMDKGAGKTAWMLNGGALASEVARKIDSKPEEEWLVIYHGKVNGGAIPDQIRGLLSTSPDRVHFLNWGKHKGTNEFRRIQNVILAGLNNHPETDYEMKARYFNSVLNHQQVSKDLVQEIEAGELKHHILQALCRSSVRQGNGHDCGPCNAYIIAPKRSGVRGFLPEVFPSCTITTWEPAKRKLSGWVADAVAEVKAFFADSPDGVFLYSELRDALGISDTSNFNKRVRRHESYKLELDRLGIEEVSTGNHRHRDALARKPQPFGSVEVASYVADV